MNFKLVPESERGSHELVTYGARTNEGRRREREGKRRTGRGRAPPADVLVPHAIDAGDRDDVAVAVGGSEDEDGQRSRPAALTEHGLLL